MVGPYWLKIGIIDTVPPVGKGQWGELNKHLSLYALRLRIICKSMFLQWDVQFQTEGNEILLVVYSTFVSDVCMFKY